jgi:hypothetical protein
VSDDSSTWTIAISYPNGVTCLAIAGENWQPRERETVLGRAL